MRLLIGGDFAAGYLKRNPTTTYGFSERMVRLFKEADYSIVNFESPILENNVGTCIEKVGPALSMSREYVKYLSEVGVKAVTLANNHFCDYGDEGVEGTLKALDIYGLKHVGGGRNTQEKKAGLDISDDTAKVVVLNYCENEFSTLYEKGSNDLNIVQVVKDVEGKSNQGKTVVVIIHGGHEGYNLPSPRMKELYRFFIEKGASVVINHHQHCFSGYENYKNGVIFYGLGNLFFPLANMSMAWRKGYLVQLDINGDEVEWDVFPYQLNDESLMVDLMREEEIISFKKEINSLNGIIADDAHLKQSFDAFCKSVEKNNVIWYTPYSSRILQALYRRGFLPSFMSRKKRVQLLNALRCESHRDVSIQLFK